MGVERWYACSTIVSVDSVYAFRSGLRVVVDLCKRVCFWRRERCIARVRIGSNFRLVLIQFPVLLGQYQLRFT